MRCLRFMFLAVSIVGCTWCSAWEVSLADDSIRELIVDPTTEPRAALRNRLLPASTELVRGNAAPIYLRLIHERPGEFLQELREKMSDWSERELSELPVDEARGLIASQAYYLDQIHFAGLRDDCDWEYTVGEVSPVDVRLPELQQLRSDARMLRVKARTELASGDFERAIRTLCDGFALARHVGRTSIPVNALVAHAISRLMADGVEELIVQPGAPNLYWALAAMTEHPVDVTCALEWETTLLTQIFPELADLDRARTPEQWQAIVDDMEAWLETYQAELASMNSLANAGEGSNLQPEKNDLRQITVDRARELMVENEWHTIEEVAAMSDAEIIVRQTAYVAEWIGSNEMKWAYLPYWQSAPTAQERSRASAELAKQLEVFPFSSLLLPASFSARTSQVIVERRLASLQLVESLRHHAATHDGAWPTTLEELELPAPLDPITGQPFEYAVADGVATIESSLPPTLRASNHGLQYRVRVRK